MKELQAWRKLSERRPGDVQLDTELKQIQKTATKRTRAAWHANVTNTSQQQRGKTRQGLGMSDNSTCEPVFCLTIGALSVGHKHSRRSSCFRSKAAQHRGRRKRQGPLSTAVAVSVSSNSQTHRQPAPTDSSLHVCPRARQLRFGLRRALGFGADAKACLRLASTLGSDVHVVPPRVVGPRIVSRRQPIRGIGRAIRLRMR